jgi:hypothetical protein
MSSVMRFDEWQDSNGVPVASGAGGAFSAPGSIIAVKSALFTGTQVASSVAAAGNVAVTDLSITHEVANASNKLIISAFVGALGNSQGEGNAGLAIHDGTGLINVAASPGTRTAVSSGGYSVAAAGGGSNVTRSPAVTFVHTPGAGSKTYTVRVLNISNTSRTLYINRADNDSDDPSIGRAISALVIQEVSV